MLNISSEIEKKARQDLREVAILAYNRGYLAGTEGNLSIRLSPDCILSTASSTCKGRLSDDEILLTDYNGKPVNTAPSAKKPSTELEMHLTVYAQRPDVKAIVHAHPSTAVGFTVAGKSLSVNALPEIICTLGSIPTAPYATPSTNEISTSIEALVKDHDAIMLAHHGSLTMGNNIWEAFFKLEALEQYAKTILVAHLLGGANSLSHEQIQKLLSIRSVYGLTRDVKIS